MIVAKFFVTLELLTFFHIVFCDHATSSEIENLNRNLGQISIPRIEKNQISFDFLEYEGRKLGKKMKSKKSRDYDSNGYRSQPNNNYNKFYLQERQYKARQHQRQGNNEYLLPAFETNLNRHYDYTYDDNYYSKSSKGQYYPDKYFPDYDDYYYSSKKSAGGKSKKGYYYDDMYTTKNSQASKQPMIMDDIFTDDAFTQDDLFNIDDQFYDSESYSKKGKKSRKRDSKKMSKSSKKGSSKETNSPSVSHQPSRTGTPTIFSNSNSTAPTVGNFTTESPTLTNTTR